MSHRPSFGHIATVSLVLIFVFLLVAAFLFYGDVLRQLSEATLTKFPTERPDDQVQRTPKPERTTAFPVAPTPLPKMSGCPSQTFDKFLEAFGERSDVQRAFTRFPLRVTTDNSTGYLKPPPVSQNQAESEFQVFPDAEGRGGEKPKIEARGARRRKVTIVGTQYYFERAACWELVRIDYGSSP